MKKFFLFAAIALLSLSSCQNDDQELVSNVAISPDIDPETDPNSQPFILKENVSNGKMTGPPSNDWTLTASHEFALGPIGIRQWNVEQSSISRATGGRHPDLDEWYFNKDNVSISGGRLRLKSKKITKHRLDGAAVTAKGKKFDKLYGYFEARIYNQDPMKVGSHTAMWLMNDSMFTSNNDDSGADGMEIDVYESVYNNETTLSTLHIDGYAVGSKESIKKNWDAPGLVGNWNTYGLMWNKGRLEMYYNGIMKASFEGSKWVPQVPHYIKLSTGAAFDHDLHPVKSAAKGFASAEVGTEAISSVDYVKHWKYNY